MIKSFFPLLFLVSILFGHEKAAKEITEKGVVYLTFDDGPDSIYTPLILDVLKEYDIKATFFCLGYRMEKYPIVAERIVNEGHVIGNHTYNHAYLYNMTNEQIIEDINRTEKIVKEYAGQSYMLFRPPWGVISQEQKVFLKSHGFSIIMWDINSMDYDVKNYGSNEIVANVLAQIKPYNNNIILFHDTDFYMLESRINTVTALTEIIIKLKNDGYVFKTVTEHARSVLELAETRTRNEPTPENFLSLSLIYYNNNMYEECIEACYNALELRPNYAKAYFNICCAHIAKARWDEAIEACQKALAIDTELKGAQINYNWAKQQIENQ